MHPMQVLWDRIEAWFAIYAPELRDNLLPGVDDDDIQDIEVELGYRLPEDVRASLRLHNGTLEAFADIWVLLNIDDILREHQKMMKVLRSMLKGYMVWWYPHWIPLAADGGGGLLCVNVASEPAGQMIRYEHETGSHWIALSFQALFSKFADDLEAGKYALDALGKLKSEQFLFDEAQLGPGMQPKYY